MFQRCPSPENIKSVIHENIKSNKKTKNNRWYECFVNMITNTVTNMNYLHIWVDLYLLVMVCKQRHQRLIHVYCQKQIYQELETREYQETNLNLCFYFLFSELCKAFDVFIKKTDFFPLPESDISLEKILNQGNL